MRAIRDLWAQLVEKRLWPVALVLVLALVAVPLVLAKSPDPAAEQAAGDATTPVAAAAAAADLRDPAEPIVSVASETVEGVPLRGRAKNPFRQRRQSPVVEEGIEGLLFVPGTGGPPQPPSGGGTGGTGTGGPDPDDGQPPQETFTYASIDVRFGRAGSALREIRDVPRLTALPQASNPVVIFLGMRGDHETALFMLSTDVQAQGLDLRCVPSRRLCEAIELSEGDVVFLDWRDENGAVTQYELNLVDVALHETVSEGKASRTYARDADRQLARLGRAEADEVQAVLDELGRAGETRSVAPPAATGPAAATPLP